MFQRYPSRADSLYIVVKRTVMVLFVVVFIVPYVYGQSSLSPQLTKLNGISIYTHLGKEQFLAGLFSETLTSNSNEFLQSEEAKRLEVKVLASSISPRFFRQLWIEAVAINASANELSKYAQNLADFSNLLKPRMRAGDILLIDRTMDSGVTITLNNTRLGSVTDKTFFDVLARAWIGAVPLSSKFRDELLREGDISVDLRSDYLSVFPSDKRIDDIKSFVINEEKNRNKEKLTAGVAISSRVDKTPVEVPVPKTIPKKKTVSTPVVIKAPATEITYVEVASVIEESIKQPVLSVPVLARAEPAIPETVVAEKVNVSVSYDGKDTDVSGETVAEVVGKTDEEDSPDFVYTAESLLSKQLYIAKLSRWTFPFVQYPKSARRHGQEGSLVLKVVIARNGKVTDISIVQNSGFLALDKAAITAVKKASPYPPIPEDIGDDNFSFSVPIAFSLQG